jgi:7,8-dihydropterin-6-yl-methyl-4-(beta-D-ribofuranosyl)aminobenzene 5'-phosphate synthase
MDARTTVAIVLGGLGCLVAVIIGALIVRFYRGYRRADQVWTAAHYPKLKGTGTVKRLTILPLVDRCTARADLVGEAGVSYLVQADDTTILFDLGLNQRGEHPSPLLRNMQALGMSLDRVDCIVISHPHLDHVGGMGYERKHTFDPSGERIDLGRMLAFVPEPMTHPTARVQVVDGPRVLVPGVATLGPIYRQLFFFGWTPEQSLAVNVKDKGIVLIIGCGHSTLQRIVERAEMLFDEPIYGMVGGLHYPVTALPVQRLLGTGNWPWAPINKKDVEASIAYLQRRHPKLVALSPHDSCNWSIEAFRRAFGDACREVLVGQEIIV